MADSLGKGITQKELDDLLTISDLIADYDEKKIGLVDDIKTAILDSGKLSLVEWQKLRRNLKEIEELVPTIDMIIRLKFDKEKKRRIASARIK